MCIEPTALPDDVEHLKQLVIAQRVQLEHLKLVIARLRPHAVCPRLREAREREIAQGELQLEELEISEDRILATLRAVRLEPARLTKRGTMRVMSLLGRPRLGTQTPSTY